MLRLVCFGDSITARKEGCSKPMLTTKLSSELENFDIINAGVSGDNTCDALTRIEKDVIKFNPDLVTVLFGANDAAIHKMFDIYTYKTNLYKITHLVKPQKIIFITPSPVDENSQFARTNDTLSKYALVVKQVANDTGSQYIDLFNEMISLENYPKILKGLRDDGLHFGEEGYNFLSGLITKKINEMFLR
ncbi:Lysophospholipase L1 [Salinibacillus kushneri]|uniref:Lysophospholipase L1 n=1 Tax=Salinibacillus kushneri TaxID=237682 RepID=A0A1I0E021_9BACI|nr:SGNH/GDSL hydrolase family protein [Salinibacillus kushneri]SET37637.1 Lysophospholipase L1 [Salinibacillus kushneri]